MMFCGVCGASDPEDPCGNCGTAQWPARTHGFDDDDDGTTDVVRTKADLHAYVRDVRGALTSDRPSERTGFVPIGPLSQDLEVPAMPQPRTLACVRCGHGNGEGAVECRSCGFQFFDLDDAETQGHEVATDGVPIGAQVAARGVLIEILLSGLEGARIPLTGGSTFVGSQNFEVLRRDNSVARAHVEFWFAGSALRMRPLASPIYLRGHLASEECDVTRGDEIVLGRTRFRVEF